MVKNDANRQEYDRWLKQAKHDLKTAKSTAKEKAHDWACFLSQQAAEKALKSYLYLQGHRAVLGHSVMMLLQRCATHHPSFQLIEDVKRLDEVYITSRYPNGLQEGTPEEFFKGSDSKECIKLAEKTIRTVERLCGKPKN